MSIDVSGFYQFVRPHHKKTFDEKCQALTGQGCGYKADHSLSKDEKKALMQQSGKKQLGSPNAFRTWRHITHNSVLKPDTKRQLWVSPHPLGCPPALRWIRSSSTEEDAT